MFIDFIILRNESSFISILLSLTTETTKGAGNKVDILKYAEVF